MIFSDALNLVLNLIYPPKCVFCRKLLEINTKFFLCEKCMAEYKGLIDKVCCERCGKPIVSFGRERLCYHCLSESHFYCKRIISAFSYEGEVKAALLRFKDNSVEKYSEVFASYMFKIFQKEYSSISFNGIVGVPANKKKSLSRVNDPVSLLCKDISKLSGIPIIKNSLRKTRKTRKQADLSYSERQTNLAHSIKADENLVKDKTILLVDDVCTTRATLSECSRALKRAGAKAVCALTLCTTLNKNIDGKDNNK